MTENIMPNSPQATATENNAVAISDQSIAAKMDAMKSMTLRNQLRATEGTETGETAEANAESPVAPEGHAQPEVADDEYQDVEGSTEEYDTQETVSDNTDADSTQEELIDFIDFAETNPNAKFKFMRNGKEIVVDAKKAAAILGQGSAIHEDARQLKIEKAEFDEYLREQRSQQEGLTLAMEFTVAPQLQRAYDEILKTQNYNVTFQQQLNRTQDPAEQARIMASMEQNNRYMQQQSQVIGRIKPNLDQFRELRKQQVAGILEQSRKAFTDKELKNEYVYNELREKIGKAWANANGETLPGVKNIDLISSDEFLLGLVRDGLKFRNRPSVKQAGSSVAALTGRKGISTTNSKNEQDSVERLREQAKGGDKKAADNLLVAQLARLRASRGSR
jgi:hypothetical protein